MTKEENPRHSEREVEDVRDANEVAVRSSEAVGVGEDCRATGQGKRVRKRPEYLKDYV